MPWYIETPQLTRQRQNELNNEKLERNSFEFLNELGRKRGHIINANLPESRIKAELLDTIYQHIKNFSNDVLLSIYNNLPNNAVKYQAKQDANSSDLNKAILGLIYQHIKDYSGDQLAEIYRNLP